MKVRYIAYFALAALAAALFMNRNIPTSQKKRATVQPAAQQPQPEGPVTLDVRVKSVKTPQ